MVTNLKNFGKINARHDVLNAFVSYLRFIFWKYKLPLLLYYFS